MRSHFPAYPSLGLLLAFMCLSIGCDRKPGSSDQVAHSGDAGNKDPKVVKVRDPKANADLQKAALEGLIEGVRSALERGADVNVRDQFERTPIMEAATHGYLDVARLLVDCTLGDQRAMATRASKSM